MSFYFRDRPKFSDKLRGKTGDELLQEIKQQFDEDSKSFFEPTNRSGRDAFDRHSTFSRAFPFDDEGFGRRGDIRAHLDDLVARHPEFADHLLGPPWGDSPLRNSFHNRNRDTGNAGRNSRQGYNEEDAKSQASGSSVASGTSTASSSHSEGDNNQEKSSTFEQTDKRNHIPQYGLRNTVDIGQHHHDMDNVDKSNRGQRSMSAPPENRQCTNQQQDQSQNQQQQPSQQPQRYVSRIDITPQHNQPPQPEQQKPQQQQKAQQQQSNVRHIPIFVEGRDEPVLPRNVEEPMNFCREPSPTQFQRPHFQSRSPFGQSFGTRHNQWPPHFQDSFYPMSSEYEQSPRRQQQTHNFQSPKQQPQQYTERQPPQQQYSQKPSQQQHYEQTRQQKAQPQQQQQEPQQEQEPPKPKPNIPKDPLERVALVQKEVDSLAEQVRQYDGNSRTDKRYIYLDEMLTRELIKLDDIETEGRDNVRQARKNAIRTIQETISLLESKAALPSQQASPETQEIRESEGLNSTEEKGQSEAMEVDEKTEEMPQNKEAIPLPPGPSSPTQKPEESKEVTQGEMEKSTSDHTVNHQQESEATCEKMDGSAAEKSEVTPMDLQENSEQSAVTENKSENASTEKEQPENVTEEKKVENVKHDEKEQRNVGDMGEKREGNISEEQKTQSTSKKKKKSQMEEKKKSDDNVSTDKESVKEEEKTENMEVGDLVKQSPKSPKRGKKTKKQAPPVSEKPIPLPAPESTETSAK